MDIIYTAASCTNCETDFGSQEGQPLSPAFIKKARKFEYGEYSFSCPICGEYLEMQTAEYDESKRYHVIRYWMMRSASDGKIRSDVVWTDCGGSWQNAIEQHDINMKQKDVSASFIIRCFKDDRKEVADEDIMTISNR